MFYENGCSVVVINGRQLIKLPSGETIPMIISTVIEQGVDDASNGIATATITLLVNLIDTVKEK